MSYYPSYLEQLKGLSSTQKSILKKISHIEKIEGWLLIIEAIELYSLALNLKSKDPIICEIGTWKGKSAYVFANALLNKKSGTLYCIDPFNGDGDAASKQSYQNNIKKLKKPLKKIFEETMRKYKLLSKIKIIARKSESAFSLFPKKQIDLLFIDGNHNYEAVKTDYNLWSPLIRRGGTIVLHDVGAMHVDGPRRIMKKYILNNQVWKNARIVGEMGIAIKA